MNYIDEIKNTEAQAHKIVEDAQQEAAEKLDEARADTARQHEELAQKLTDELTDALESQKKELAETYRKITTSGQKKADEIRSTALRNKKEAVQYVLDNLS